MALLLVCLCCWYAHGRRSTRAATKMNDLPTGDFKTVVLRFKTLCAKFWSALAPL